MNVTKLEIVADEDAGNIHVGEVVAYRRVGDTEWHDPHGGFFDEPEQEELTRLAQGKSTIVRLSGVKRERIFIAHLCAKF